MVLYIYTLVGLAVLLWLLYAYLTKNFEYWEKLVMKGPKPIPFFGNFKDVSLSKIHRADFYKNIYDAYPNQPAVGLFYGSNPRLLIKDQEMIKDVLIKNFAVFPNRGFSVHEDVDPLAVNLFFLHREKWRLLRKNFGPVFSSTKIRNMNGMINTLTEKLVGIIEESATKNEPIEIYELAVKFSIDVFGFCFFGLNLNTMCNNESLFHKYHRMMLTNSWFNLFRIGSRSLSAWAAKLLIPIVRNEQMNEFYVNVTRSTMDQRKKNNIKRNDLIDQLIDIEENPDKINEKEVTDVQLAAHAHNFLVAGSENPGLTICYALYELSRNPDIQDNLRREILLILEENNGEINSDTIKKMMYLDKVFKETLRKHPPDYQISRTAVQDYTFEKNNISISKGTGIIIPVDAIHYDSSIYPNPEKFDPERFDEEVSSSRPPMSFLPFGGGPRRCLGYSFIDIPIKMALVAAIKNFQFDVCEKTPKVYKKLKCFFLTVPEGGIHLSAKKI